MKTLASNLISLNIVLFWVTVYNHGFLRTLVVQFVNESRFANCEFANLFFDFDELQF